MDCRRADGLKPKWNDRHRPAARLASESASAGRVDSSSVKAGVGGILTINLSAIAANWELLNRQAMPSECAAVIKADGYGCGIEPVARALTHAGCRTFFVADIGGASGARRRSKLPQFMCSTGLLPRNRGNLRRYRRSAGDWQSRFELAEWDAFCSANQWRGGAALHVDTGMNRLGVSVDEAAALAPSYPYRKPRHPPLLIRSLSACAEQPEHALNQRQIDLFREVRLLYRGIPARSANSSGIFPRQQRALRHGPPRRPCSVCQSDPVTAILMHRLIELRARVGAGTDRSEGRDDRLQRDLDRQARSAIAVVAVGYADGYPRAASASTRPRFRGRYRRRYALPTGRARVDGPAGSRCHCTTRNAVRRGDLDHAHRRHDRGG